MTFLTSMLAFLVITGAAYGWDRFVPQTPATDASHVVAVIILGLSLICACIAGIGYAVFLLACLFGT